MKRKLNYCNCVGNAFHNCKLKHPSPPLPFSTPHHTLHLSLRICHVVFIVVDVDIVAVVAVFVVALTAKINKELRMTSLSIE